MSDAIEEEEVENPTISPEAGNQSVLNISTISEEHDNEQVLENLFPEKFELELENFLSSVDDVKRIKEEEDLQIDLKAITSEEVYPDNFNMFATLGQVHTVPKNSTSKKRYDSPQRLGKHEWFATYEVALAAMLAPATEPNQSTQCAICGGGSVSLAYSVYLDSACNSFIIRWNTNNYFYECVKGSDECKTEKGTGHIPCSACRLKKAFSIGMRVPAKKLREFDAWRRAQLPSSTSNLGTVPAMSLASTSSKP